MGKGKVNLVNQLPEDTTGNGKRILRLGNNRVVPALAAGNNINVNLNDVNLSKQNGYNFIWLTKVQMIM